MNSTENMMSKNKRSVFVVLLHDPMVDRNGKEVVTAVTNLDIHDIARSSKTYGIDKYFIVNPEDEQEKLVNNIVGHWKENTYREYHPKRAQALDLVQFCRTFTEALNEAKRISGPSKAKPFVVMPDARPLGNSISYAQLRQKMESGRLSDQDDGNQSLIIVFGTGWGIAPRFFENVDQILDPIRSQRGAAYNHLSVRAAAAIVLDRLFGIV